MKWLTAFCIVLRTIAGGLCHAQTTQPTQTTIYLVRHAQAVLNVSHDPQLTPAQLDQLTDKGRQQAEVTAQSLMDKGVVAVVTAPPVRAQQTGQIIADAIGIKQIKVDDRLAPLRHGLMSPTGAGMMNTTKAPATTEAAESESMAVGVARAKGVLVQLNHQHSGQAVVVVATGDIIAGILGEADGTPVNQRWPADAISAGSARAIVIEQGHIGPAK